MEDKGWGIPEERRKLYPSQPLASKESTPLRRLSISHTVTGRKVEEEEGMHAIGDFKEKVAPEFVAAGDWISQLSSVFC